MIHSYKETVLEGVRLRIGNGMVRNGRSRRKLVFLSLDPWKDPKLYLACDFPIEQGKQAYK
jgi:hypothetical protein